MLIAALAVAGRHRTWEVRQRLVVDDRARISFDHGLSNFFAADFGGGVAPYIAGGIADAYGLPSVLNVALIGVVLGVVVCLFLRETAPVKVSASRAAISTST